MKKIVLFLIVFLAITSPIYADSVPPLINYQGMLTDSDGNPLEGVRNLTFNIYDAASGGTLIWGPQIFGNVDGDDCNWNHPYLGCPEGYTKAGSWHVGGKCNSYVCGAGYENGNISAGWMCLCITK